MAGETRERRFCSECKPHLCEEEGPVLEYIFDIIFERDDEDWCSCTFGERFLDDSWLCIPCFIKQEAEAYRRPLKKKIFKWETNADGSRKLVGTEVCLLWPSLITVLTIIPRSIFAIAAVSLTSNTWSNADGVTSTCSLPRSITCVSASEFELCYTSMMCEDHKTEFDDGDDTRA